MGDATCLIEECGRKPKGRGWCGTHYERWRRHGCTDHPGPTAEERFWAKVDADGDCWVWTGANVKGHGVFRDETGKLVYAHRWVWMFLVGPIPPRFVIDHLCRNQSCVNPDHLQPVLGAVNTGRGFRTKRTHCPWGHRYAGGNVYRSNKGERRCRACNHARLASLPTIKVNGTRRRGTRRPQDASRAKGHGRCDQLSSP